METQNLWRTVLSDLELQLSKPVFQTFLSHTTLLTFDGKTATIGCRKAMLVNLIEKRYHNVIKSSLDEHTKTDTFLVFTAHSPVGIHPHRDAPLFTSIRAHTLETQLPQAHFHLNNDYTFDTYAVSSTNQMAYAATTAVSNNPGTSYNPLFLYGGVGVGKTHLMQAIGHSVLKKNPKIKIIYRTGEEFTNEIIEAISTKTTTSFKKRYRQLDMLFIDDIQFIAGKNAVQEEFFHTFNAIQQVKGQIVLTSDRPPEEINKLEDRLRSRFEGGLTIDIGQPDFELRTAILLIKAKQRNISLHIEHAKLIASHVDNTRKLEGIFVRVLTESQTNNVPIDDALIRSVLGKTIKDGVKKRMISPDEVMNAVAQHYNVKISQLKGAKRDALLSLPRQILYYLLRVELNLPLMEIGASLGGRDHTTVLHGVRKITNLLSTSPQVTGDINGIKNKIFV